MISSLCCTAMLCRVLFHRRRRFKAYRFATTGYIKNRTSIVLFWARSCDTGRFRVLKVNPAHLRNTHFLCTPAAKSHTISVTCCPLRRLPSRTRAHSARGAVSSGISRARWTTRVEPLGGLLSCISGSELDLSRRTTLASRDGNCCGFPVPLCDMK